MQLLDQWVLHSLAMSGRKADFYSGCRKILRGQQLFFPKLDNSLSLEHAGYTKMKLRLLEKAYLHEESKAIALKMWEGRLKTNKYGSVSFTTYNHMIKGHSNKKFTEEKSSKPNRASVMGPCIQSVSLTYLGKNRCAVDVFYRTTELFKKFPADLVLIRDVLLKDFELPGFEGVNCYFANMTCHPMYFVAVLPHLGSGMFDHMDRLKKKDEHFFNWTVEWTARYLCPQYSRGIAKFSQALRTQAAALSAFEDDPKQLRKLRKYLEDNHPGYRNNYEEPEEDEYD